MDNTLVPIVIERVGQSERAMDIYSRLIQDRVVMLNGPVNDHSMNSLVAQLLYLETQSDKTPITLMINSPGGSVYAGLSLADTMRYIKAPVHTVVNGMAMSMGAFLLSHGEKGERAALPNATIMIHQVMSGISGGTQETDIQIHAAETARLKRILTQNLAENCGRSYEEVLEACERDKYMSAQQALEFGIIDKIIERK